MQISAISLGLTRPAPSGLEALVRAIYPDVWYDPSDLTTLYQDAAGTTPVTAVEQAVGLILDKSKGLVLGPELVVNGDFSNGTTGWTANIGSIAVTNGELAVTGPSSAGRAVNQTPLVTVANRWYRVTGTMRRGTGTGISDVAVRATTSSDGSATGLLQQQIGGAAVGVTVAVSFVFMATSTATYIGLVGNGEGYFDNISVRELPGNHAYHTPGDTTTRPVLSRRINLLTKTERFDDVAWIKTRTSITSNAAIAPDGTLTGFKLVENTAFGAHYMQQGPFSTTRSFVFTAWVKAGERTTVGIQDAGVSVFARFDLSNGTLISGSGSIESFGSGWYKISATLTPTYGYLGLLLYGDSANTNYEGDGTSGIYVWRGSLVPADLASLPYQRVNTATDYDANPALFPAYLRCDGTNDGMQTNAIDFTATDKMFVSAGVRKLSDAADGAVVELSTSSANNGMFNIFAPGSSGAARYQSISKGTLSAIPFTSSATFNAPNSSVLALIGDISGDSAIMRLNGTQVASSASDQGTGNYGNYPLYLFRRGGSSLPFNGWFYGAVIKGATLTAAQIATVERYLAGKTKTVVLA